MTKQVLSFLKNWTLPSAMAFGTIVYLIFYLVPGLDAAGTSMKPFFTAILPLFMSLILFVTFCKVDFRQMRPVRWHLWVSLFQVGTVCAVMAVILLLHLQNNWLILAEGVLTCIIAPCAAAAPVITGKLGGSVEAITTYTFITNFITAMLVPLFFPMINPAAGMSFIAAFLLILYKVFTILVLPMIAAYIVKHYMHRFHAVVISVKDLSFYLWGGSLTIVTGTTVMNIVHARTTLGFLLTIAASGLVLCLFQYGMGRLIGRRFDSAVDCGQALGQKNTAFAIWIAFTYLNPLSSVGPGCYILWQNIINSGELWQQRKKDAQEKENNMPAIEK
jgi:BASS family bile acid:Na+ symporter